MPIYEYACQHKRCKQVKDVLHSFVELEHPSEETLQDIQCPKGHGAMKRVFNSAPHLAGMQNGTSVGEGKLLSDKQQQRKHRSKLHFKNDVLPGLKDKQVKRHFEKKLKGLKGDHEKLK